MKRIFNLILSFIITASLLSCGRISQPPKGSESGSSSSGGSQSESKSEEKLDKKEGQNTVEGYLTALVLRDDKEVKNFYSTKLKQQVVSIAPVQEPHPNGYKMDTMEDKEGKLEGKATVYSISTGTPYFASDESTITVVKEKGSYVIDKIEKSKSTEVIEKDKSLFMKKEGEIKGKEIIKLDDLPKFGSPQGGTPGQKFTVGHDAFGPIALDGESKKLAVTTLGTYPSLMVVDIEGKKASVLDLFFEGTPRALSWSGDGKFLSVMMAGANGSSFINIYEAEKEKKVDDPMKDAFDRSKYSINTPYWNGENMLLFNVSAIGSLTEDEKKQIGAYKFDPKNISLTKS